MDESPSQEETHFFLDFWTAHPSVHRMPRFNCRPGHAEASRLADAAGCAAGGRRTAVAEDQRGARAHGGRAVGRPRVVEGWSTFLGGLGALLPPNGMFLERAHQLV